MQAPIGTDWVGDTHEKDSDLLIAIPCFDEKELLAMAEHAATALGISIYGGDAIISAEGTITRIDMNDWPSFAPGQTLSATSCSQQP